MKTLHKSSKKEDKSSNNSHVLCLVKKAINDISNKKKNHESFHALLKGLKSSEQKDLVATTLINTLDHFADNSSVIYRCLKIIYCLLEIANDDFLPRFQSFIPEISSLDLLDFGNVKVKHRNKIHVLANSITMYLLRKEPLIKPELINLENLITNPTISFKEFPINNGINTHDDDPIDWGAQNDIVTSSSKEFFEIEDLHFSSEFMLKAHEPNELVYHDEPIDVPKENVKENNNSEIVDLIQFSSEPSIVSKQPNVEFEAISIQSERCGSQNSIEFEPISQPFHIGSTPRRGTYDLSIGRVKSDDMFEPLSSVRSTSDMFEPLSGVSPNETFEAVENPIDFGLTCDFEPIEDDDDSEEDKKQLKPTSLSEILQFCDKGKELVSFF